MKKMINRVNRKDGFTLAELLIVVAIIAVLVAVSIPIFTSRLEKAREATDVANLRAAYAAGVAEYLGNESAYSTVDSTTLYYNAGAGKLDDSGDACLKGTGTDGGTSAITIGGYSYDGSQNVAGKKITVTITKAGVVTIAPTT